MSLSPQDRDPLHLCPCVLERYEAVRDSLWDEWGIHITLIETLRQIDRQIHYVKMGASRTMKSFHLPQPPKNLSLAFDAVPTSLLTIKGWDPLSKDWVRYGVTGEEHGLKWGGRWKRLQDRPHLYLPKCLCVV